MTDEIDTTRAKGISGPDAGFGRLWRKIYQVTLADVEIEPEELLSVWKRSFGRLWPGQNQFFAPVTGLREGEVAEIELEMPGGVSLSTGVRLLYSSDTAFALLAPPGHVFSGWTTFSAFPDSGHTVARVEVLMRASDPLFEIGLEIFGHRQEDRFWLGVLTNLAKTVGSSASPTATNTCVDRRFLLRNASNLRYNAVIRNGLHKPSKRIRQLFGRRSQQIDPTGGQA